VSSGAITGLSSVKLAGKEYETQNTSFVVDGQPGSQNDLKVGMVVTVNGSLSSTGTRSATTITQEDVVEGAIQFIPGTDRIVVLGQTVLIDHGTVFDNNIPGQNISGLVVGSRGSERVREGKADHCHADREEKSAGHLPGKRHRRESNSGAQTFMIGGLTVHTQRGRQRHAESGNAWKDLLVEVKGSPCTQARNRLSPPRLNRADQRRERR
jgi:hypothetical protein